MNIAWSIFPKFYKHLSVPELAELIHTVGLDTTNVVIRDGYWVTRDTLVDSLPAFVETMRQSGLELHFATAGFMPDELIADPTPLAILADNGIREFRMGYFHCGKGQSPAEAIADARRQMEQLAELCRTHDVRAVYQVHHGMLIPGPWAVWHVVKDLPARHIGVMLDPGNQVFEGWDNWHRSAALLGENLTAMGIKDAGIYRDADPADPSENKGWRRCLEVTLDEGLVNWYEVARALKDHAFNGTFVFMPFYNPDQPDVMTAKLQREVRYLRKVFADVESEKEASS